MLVFVNNVKLLPIRAGGHVGQLTQYWTSAQFRCHLLGVAQETLYPFGRELRLLT